MSRKKTSLLILLITMPVILVFQNCSEVGFSKEDELAIAQSVQDNSEIKPSTTDQVPTEYVPYNPETIPSEPNPPSDPSLFFDRQAIPAYIPEQSELEVIVLLDGSSSMAPYTDKVLSGLENLINNIPDGILAVKVFALNKLVTGGQLQSNSVITNNGLMSYQREETILPSKPAPYRGRVVITDTHTMGTPIAELADGVKLSTLSANQVAEKKQALLTKIRQFMSGTSVGAASNVDTDPDLICGVLALMAQDRPSQTSKPTRKMFVAITDEDQVLTQKKCIKQSTTTYDKVKGNPIKLISHYYLARTKTEGGGFGSWERVKRNLVAGDGQSCRSAGRQIIETYVNRNTELRKLASDSIRSCHERTLSGIIRKVPDKAKPAFNINWLSDFNGDVESQKQIDKVIGQNTNTQYFFGLFSVLSENDIKNSDQEVSKNLQTFISSFMPTTNRYFQSIVDSDFSGFINKAMEFKKNTEVNKISIAHIYDQLPEGTKVKVVRVKVIGLNGASVGTFENVVTQGDNAILYDSSVDLSQGAVVEVAYLVL